MIVWRGRSSQCPCGGRSCSWWHILWGVGWRSSSSCRPRLKKHATRSLRFWKTCQTRWLCLRQTRLNTAISRWITSSESVSVFSTPRSRDKQTWEAANTSWWIIGVCMSWKRSKLSTQPRKCQKLISVGQSVWLSWALVFWHYKKSCRHLRLTRPCLTSSFLMRIWWGLTTGQWFCRRVRWRYRGWISWLLWWGMWQIRLRLSKSLWRRITAEMKTSCCRETWTTRSRKVFVKSTTFKLTWLWKNNRHYWTPSYKIWREVISI